MVNCCPDSFAGENIAVTSLECDTFAGGQSVFVRGTGFGSRENNSGGEYFLARLWDNFEQADFSNWTFRVSGASWEISASPARLNSLYCAHKKNEYPLDAMQIRPASKAEYYASFWMYLAPDVNISNNNKYFRAGSTISNANLVWNSNSNRPDMQMTVEFAVGDTQVDGSDKLIESLKGSWNFIEIIWALPVLGSSNDHAKVYVNGNLTNSLPESGGLWPPGEEMTNSPYISIGTWFGTTYGIGSGWYYDDVYIDYTQARVLLGNSSLFAASDHREIQLPTSWSDASITINVNQGSFQPGNAAYIFVIDSDGNASDGFPVIIGGSSEATPAAPANLRVVE